MRIRMLPLRDPAERDVAAWRELARRAAEPNPFLEPEFVLPAARHLDAEGVSLLVAEDSSGWQACLPVHKPPRWRRLPLPTLAVWRHSYCFLGTPLVAADRLEPALSALLERGRREPSTAAFALDWLVAAGPLEACLRELLDGTKPLEFERFERAALERRPESTYLDATLTGHRRRELQRLRRALARDAGGPVTTTDRAGDPDACDEFLHLEASGWKGRSGTAFSCLPGHSQFFREMCAGFAGSGRLELLELAAAGEPVAMKCNLLAGDTSFGFKIAYDESRARYSPGILLERAMVDLFHDRRELAVMDSCAAPDNQMINRLWPDRRPIVTLLVPSEGPLGWAARHGARAATAVRDRMRSVR